MENNDHANTGINFRIDENKGVKEIKTSSDEENMTISVIDFDADIEPEEKVENNLNDVKVSHPSSEEVSPEEVKIEISVELDNKSLNKQESPQNSSSRKVNVGIFDQEQQIKMPSVSAENIVEIPREHTVPEHEIDDSKALLKPRNNILKFDSKTENIAISITDTKNIAQENKTQPIYQHLTDNSGNPNGKLIIDIDKGLLVDENEFDGVDNQDLIDPEVLNIVENEVNELHPMQIMPSN
jgi:hypothetical protein